MTDVDADRSAVRRQLLDVDHLEAVLAHEMGRRPEREVREVLVVDRVELGPFEQPLNVRELEREQAVRRQQPGKALDEVVEVGDLGEDVVAGDQVGPAARCDELVGELHAEEACERRDALGVGHRRDVLGGLDPEDPDLPVAEVLEQVAVVAGDLDDEARRAAVAARRSSARRTAGHARPTTPRTTRSRSTR